MTDYLDVSDKLGPSDEEPGPRRTLGAGVARTIVATLQQMIANGRLLVGEALPPERGLARELNVSRASLREALSILATIGVVSIEAGRGTFVRRQSSGEQAHYAASWRFAARYSPAEVYQFRYIAESHAAQLAAIHHTGDEIGQLRSNLDVFRRAARDIDFGTFGHTDFEFHRLIMRFSRNRLFADLHENFANVLIESTKLPIKPDKLWEPVKEHERIVEALSMRDPDGAGYYMRRHLNRTADRVGIAITELI